MNPEEQNDQKNVVFKIGIIVIVAVIFFLWLANLRNVLEDNKKENSDLWQKITQDMDSSLSKLNEISNNLASTSVENNNFVKDLVNRVNSATSTATTSIISTSTVKTEIKEELVDIIKKGTTTVKNSCPEFINCMPTIGEARPCTIPVGCENVTQIAY